MNTHETKPILCGTDFSENATQAANAAAALAVRAGQPLLLVHVADEFGGHAGSKESLAAFLRPLRKHLRAEAARLRQAGAEVEVKLLDGSVPEKAIEELAGTQRPSLVVVSSVSKSAFDRWTLGSVSEHLAQSVASPTLVVRDAAPFEAWARGERALKVFVAADFTSVSEAPLCWVAALRRIGPCEVTVAHVNHPQEECERLGDGSFTFTENSPLVQRVLERDLKKKVRALLGGERVSMVVEPLVNRADARLIELATQAQADVIVIGTRQRQGLSRFGEHSVSRGILRHAPMNVVCVPASAGAEEGTPIPKIQRVLVATDFSEIGNRAVPYAFSLVPKGGTVFLVHTTPSMPVPGLLALNVTGKMKASRAEHATRLRETSAQLQALIPRAAAERGVASEVKVIENADPAKAICQAARRLGAEVICLGSHGRSGLSATLLGSVAQAVMAQCRRPVLVVRPPAA